MTSKNLVLDFECKINYSVKMIIWDKEKTDRIFEMRQQGITYQEIAQEFGTNKANISSVISKMKKNGYNIIKVVPWTEQDQFDLISLRLEGKSNQDIANILGRGIDCIKKKASELVKLGAIPRQTSGGQSSGFDPGKPAKVYLLDFGGFHKIGITQQKISYRFAGAPAHTVLDYVETDLDNAMYLEKELKKSIRPYQYIAEHPWFERNGKTECFKTDQPIRYLEDIFAP